MPSLRRGDHVAVTGVNGFVGHHLAAELGGYGYKVIGIGRDETALAPHLLDDYITADLTVGWPAIREVAGVVHLAGHSAVGPSFSEPMRYITDNSAMVVHLGEAALVGPPVGRVLVVSSGAVYDATAQVALRESHPVSPSSPYVVSKLTVESLAGYYRSRGVDVVVARPFNHVGPGQGQGFLVPDLTHGLAEAVRAARRLQVGDLGTARDYTDVRDVARAYRLLLEAERLREPTYNVCSGRPRTGEEILEMVEQAMHADRVEREVDSRRIRPGDPRIIRGDASALTRDTGWESAFDLERTIADYVESLSSDG